MNVPILRIPYSDHDRKDIHENIDRVLSSGHLTMGEFTAEFEREFAKFNGSRFAVACSSCTSALEIIIRSLGIRDRSIILPTNTFMATALSVVNSGNRVVFADSRPETLCLDVDDVMRRIGDDTAAVIIVHIGGIIDPDITRLRELCDKKGVFLVEDCAHAHGCSINGDLAGNLGIAGGFSFFPTKVLTTGEGGMITTNDEDLYARALSLRNHGKDPAVANRILRIGSNWRMSEITAVLGVQQMQRADEIVRERQEIAEFYNRALADLEGVSPLKLADGVSSSYYKYVAYLDERYDRTQVKNMLKNDYEISLTGEVYADLCHTEPVWNDVTGSTEPDKTWSTEVGAFPGAEYSSAHQVCLPVYPGLTRGEQEWVVDSLRTVTSELDGG
jgi:perosamine synthetase